MNSENKKLKRQSRQLLDSFEGMDVKIEDIKAITEAGADEPEPEEQNKHWNDMVEGKSFTDVLMMWHGGR